MTKKLILLDLDDTLWDTWANNKESLNELYTALCWGRYFVSFEAFFETYYYPINHELWSLYNQERISKDELCLARLYKPLRCRLEQATNGSEASTLSPEERAVLAALVEQDSSYWQGINEDFMARIREKRRLCPGAMTLLEHLHTKYPICIVSNGFPEVQYSKLKHSGLEPYIEQVVLSDEVGYNKPNPKIFEHALDLMGYQAKEAVMIGDSWLSDIEGANNAGIDSIWYNRYGSHSPSESRACPCHTVGHLAEIIPLL